MTQLQQKSINAIVVLFGAYGQSDDVDRMKIYIKYLKDLNPEMLELAIKKLIAENKYLPAVSEIIQATKSIACSIGGVRVKSWDEAWGEIESKMFSTQWGKTPKWSTPEIAEAVNSYGWKDLQYSLEEQLPTIKAQVRRHYELICERNKEQKTNAFVLGEKSMSELVGANVGLMIDKGVRNE